VTVAVTLGAARSAGCGSSEAAARAHRALVDLRRAWACQVPTALVLASPALVIADALDQGLIRASIRLESGPR